MTQSTITASAVGPGMNVDGLPLVAPRVSLLSSVDVTTENDEAHWANGLRFLPDNCDVPTGVTPYWWACPEGAGTAPAHTKDTPAPEAQVLYRPYDIWVGFRCGNQALRSNDYVARANRSIEAFQSYLIEQELQLGTVAQAAGFPNDYLENAPTALNAGGNTPYVTALAELEQALATCNPGQIGVIHAQPRTVTLWLQNGLVAPEPNGRRLRTAMGTIVVPGAGYDGGGTGLATGGVASSWAYGTGMVRIWLGPIRRMVDESGSPGETHGINAAEVDRTVNTVNVRVERMVAAVWDECCQVAIRVNHTAAL